MNDLNVAHTGSWLTVGAAAAGLIALAVLAYVTVGLFQARSLVRREFAAYFLSPIAYVVLVVFLAVTGYLFSETLALLTASGPQGTEWPMRSWLTGERWFWLLFVMIPALLTMRLFAEERSTGTLEMLMTAPLRDWQVVLSKYAACLAFYVVLWLPTLVYLPILVGAQAPVWANVWTPYSVLFVAGLAAAIVGLLMLIPALGTSGRLISLGLLVGGAAAAVAGGWLHYHRDATHLVEIPVTIDPYPVLATYLGLFLAGAMFLAAGLFVSSLVANQLVAVLLTVFFGLPLVVAGFWRPEADGGAFYQLAYFFSVPLHFDRSFTRGVVDSRPVVLYVSTALFCLFLTVRSLEARRWR
jgi:ABC-type transport system involved in multi-copper enzyme maturation permease subunit